MNMDQGINQGGGMAGAPLGIFLVGVMGLMTMFLCC